MEISDDLLCMFSAQVEEQDGSFTVEVPRREVAVGDVAAGGNYRIAVLPGVAQSSEESQARTHQRERDAPEPPVEEGEVLDVEIEDIGDQGDGIARVGPGYVVIISDTQLGERVAVEIRDVRQNMAFGTVVERHDRMA